MTITTYRTDRVQQLPTVSMVIRNGSDTPMYLVYQSPGFGWWTAAPREMVGPHSSTVVTAITQEPGGTVDVTYEMPDGTRVLFAASNFRTGTEVAGTEVQGNGCWSVDRTVHAGFPDFSATYHLVGAA